MSEWIRVGERLPDVKPGEVKSVIVCVRREHNGKSYVFSANYLNCYELLNEEHGDEDGIILATGFYDEDYFNGEEGFSLCCPRDTADEVTHWMPLPEPPK